jgi:GNAT superfamily N-acetyltransferase
VRYFLARLTGLDGLVGFAKVRYPRPVPGREPLFGVELQKIYLRAGALTQGIGSQLLAAVEVHARELGLPDLWLDVLDSNQRAQQVYLRRGFQVVAKKTFTTDAGEEPMHVMHKHLS